jgi:uncharacterized SAM-binding protein YcdF (DUF218 family)
MKRYAIGFSLVGFIALVTVISLKLSTDAIAIIIGVGLGMLASVPTSLLILYILTRQNASSSSNQPPGLTNAQQPPVVIVNGGQQPSLHSGPRPQPLYQTQFPTSRTFTVVGEESTDL